MATSKLLFHLMYGRRVVIYVSATVYNNRIHFYHYNHTRDTVNLEEFRKEALVATGARLLLLSNIDEGLKGPHDL